MTITFAPNICSSMQHIILRMENQTHCFLKDQAETMLQSVSAHHDVAVQYKSIAETTAKKFSTVVMSKEFWVDSKQNALHYGLEFGRLAAGTLGSMPSTMVKKKPTTKQNNPLPPSKKTLPTTQLPGKSQY